MEASLVVPTLDRPDDLARCLGAVRALGRGGRGVDEVVVVEQGDAERARRVAAGFPGLSARTLHHPVRSLTQARNLGAEAARGRFVFFLDDDAEPLPGYVEAALDGFARNPAALGLTGRLRELPRPGAPAVALRALLLPLHVLLGVEWPFGTALLRSGRNCRPPFGLLEGRERDVEWLPGGHACYRREVFEDGFRFDAGMVRWSFGEDVLFSHRLLRARGPGSLRHVPGFAAVHRNSPERSLSPDQAVRMRVLYRFLVWRRAARRGGPLDLAAYLHGQAGLALVDLLDHGLAPRAPAVLREVLRSWAWMAANRRALARGEADVNGFVLGEGEGARAAAAGKRPRP